MATASRNTNRPSSLCKKRVGRSLPHPRGDGRNQPTVLFTMVFNMNCGMRIAEFGIKTVFLAHSAIYTPKSEFEGGRYLCRDVKGNGISQEEGKGERSERNFEQRAFSPFLQKW